jgi:uncharacterized protein YjdB
MNAVNQNRGRALAITTLVASCLTIAIACTKAVDPTPIATIALAKASDSIRIGETYQLSPVAQDQAGNTLAGRRFTFESKQPTIATVSETGLISGLANGTAQIDVTSEGKLATFFLSVIFPVANVVLVPGQFDIEVNRTQALTLTVTSAGGQTISGRAVTFTTSDPSVATVNGAGVISAIAIGQATITATVEGKTGTSRVNVIRERVNTVRITPPGSQTIRVGQTFQLTATPLNALGQPLAGRTCDWTTSNPNVATINQNGLVTAVSTGSATMTAECEDRQASTGINVLPVQVATVTLAPTTVSIFTSEDRQLTATAKDAAGNVLSFTGRSVSFNSTNLPVATINSSGVVHGVAVGSAIVSVTVDGVASNNVDVTVNAIPISTVVVTPNPGGVKIGGFTLQMAVVLRDSLGGVLPPRPTTWTISDQTQATINATGLVTTTGSAVAGGILTVTATVEGKQASATVNLLP